MTTINFHAKEVADQHGDQFDYLMERLMAEAQWDANQYWEKWFPTLPVPVFKVSKLNEDFVRIEQHDFNCSKTVYRFVATRAGSNRKCGTWAVGDIFKGETWFHPGRERAGNLFAIEEVPMFTTRRMAA